MPLLSVTDKRHPFVHTRRVALSEERWNTQQQRGIYTVERGEPFSIPVDRLSEPKTFLNREMWVDGGLEGTHRPGVVFKPAWNRWQQRTLAWLRDNVNPAIPSAYYNAVLGHDIHSTMFANLYGQHWHRGWVNPFSGDQDEPLDHRFATAPWHPLHVPRLTRSCDLHMGVEPRPGCKLCMAVSESIVDWHLRAKMINWGKVGGFVENLGLLSGGLVSQAFDSEIVDELFVGTSTEFEDFDFHEVGTSAQAESNGDTLLIATSGITRDSGTPVDEDPDYANDATITADATETWEEEGIFNNLTSVALMDRNLTLGQAVNSSDQVTYQYTLTLTPES